MLLTQKSSDYALVASFCHAALAGLQAALDAAAAARQQQAAAAAADAGARAAAPSTLAGSSSSATTDVTAGSTLSTLINNKNLVNNLVGASQGLSE